MAIPRDDKPTRLLFLTCPERGQSNCHHAVIHSLLTRHDPSILDIHLGTYSDGKTRSIPGVAFHEIRGTSAVNHLVVSRDGYIEAKNPHGEIWQRVTTRPGLWGYLKAMPLITFLSNPDGPAIVHATKDIEHIMNEVDPGLVIVDGFFAPGIDAAVKSGRKWVRLSPNTLKENATDAQGLGAFLWPMVGIGYSFPLPWYLIPLNAIALILTPIIAFFFDSHFRLTNQARHAAGYEGVVTPFVKRTRPVLCMSTPELDYPGIIPSDVICCGPILLPTKSLLQEDPTLYTWIRQGPTILVSLGSHLAVEEEYAQALLESFRVLLDKRKDVQVLWKLRKWGRNYPIDSGDARIRITGWLDVDPTTILPHVACVVHHGGSNSYHECLAAGVAQIILSPWFDCHDFGVRAEWLGVGRWGNRHAA